LGGILTGDDTLVLVDGSRQAIEKRRLARARAAGNDRDAAATADDAQNLGALRRDGAVTHHLFQSKLVALEFTDGERRPVERERRDDDVDARAIGKTRIADRRAFIDAPTDLADDTLADIEKLRV